MRREAEHCRLINVSDIEDHQEEEEEVEEEGEEEEEEARKLINKKENTVVRINISSEGMTLWQNDNMHVHCAMQQWIN